MSSYVKDGMSVGSSHNLFVFNQITHGKESHFLPTKGHGQEVKAAKGQISIIFQDHSFWYLSGVVLYPINIADIQQWMHLIISTVTIPSRFLSVSNLLDV